MPWWGVVSAAAAPVLLIGGWTIAGALQPPSFDLMTNTVSALAAIGATDRWVMTLVFVAVGVCYVTTGAALRPAAPAGRLILIGGSLAGMLVAVAPEHPGSPSISHGVWASLGFAGLLAWPAWAWHRGPSVPWALRRSFSYGYVVVQLVLLAWFVAELITGAAQVGLAERAVGAAQALWPLAVVLSCCAAAAPT